MTGASRIWTTVVTILVVTCIISERPVYSLGKRSFGESCSIGGYLTSLFSPEREERACDRDMGLLCTGTCTCPPGRVWDTSGNVLGCAGAVGSPCFGTNRNQQCVTNAHCQFGFCRCKAGFRSSGGRCEMSTNSEGVQPETRPATVGGISFPELEGLFSGFSNQHSSHSLNSFNNDAENSYNDRFQISNDNGRDHFNNDRFQISDTGHDHKNDRFHADADADNDNYNYNDRFQVSTNDRYQEYQNSRDGSGGSAGGGGIRFEE